MNRVAGDLKRQSGAALVISLILLAVILVIGLAAGSMTQNEEQMTTSFYDREVTFQAAESALRDAQAEIGGWSDLDEGDANSFDCIDSYCENIPDEDLSNRSGGSTSWQTTDSELISSVVESNSTRYYIDKLAEVTNDSDSESTRDASNYEYGSSSGTETTAYVYRVTAKSDGGDGRAAVTLQAYIKRYY